MSTAQVLAHRLPATTDDLAIRLRGMRLNSRLSQKQLSSATGISACRVGHIERGDYLPSEAEVRSWCWAAYADDQTTELLQMWAERLPEVEVY